MIALLYFKIGQTYRDVQYQLLDWRSCIVRNGILKSSGIFLVFSGLILIVAFIVELITGTLFVGLGLGSSSTELYTIIFALSEIFPQVLIAYTLEVFGLLVCIPGLVGVAAFLSQESRRKWIQTLVLSLAGVVIILLALPTLFDGLLTAYHLTSSPPPAAIPGMSYYASSDIALFLVFSSIGVAFLIGGGGGTITRLSKSSIIPREVRILGGLAAIIGLLSASSFLITYQTSIVLIVYKIAIILFSVWLLLLGALILRSDFPRFEISRHTRTAITLTGVFGISVYTAELFILPMITEPSSVDNLLSHLQSGGSSGSLFSILALIMTLLLIPSLYTIQRHLARDQNDVIRISMILIVICTALVACANILQHPLFSWAQWYHVIIDSSVYDQFQATIGIVVTTIRVLTISSVALFSLGFLLVAYHSVKSGSLGLSEGITSVFAILGLALTGLVAIESPIAYPTVPILISQIVIYTFVLFAGALFLKSNSNIQTVVETISSDN